MDIVIGAKVGQAIDALKQVGTALGRLGESASAMGARISAAFASVGKVMETVATIAANVFEEILASIGPLIIQFIAFGVIVGTVEKIIKGFADANKEAEKAMQEQAKAAEEFHKSLQGAEAGALATGIKLQALIAIARDHTSSLKEQQYALTEANKLMGQHGEKITAANVATKAITDQTNLFIQALIAEAVAAKYADRLADLIVQQGDATKAYTKAQNERTAADKAYQQATAGQQGPYAGFEEAQKAQDAFKNVTTAATAYKNIRAQVIDTEKDFNKVEEQSIALMALLGIKTKETTDKTKEQKKEFEVPRIRILKGNNLDIVRQDVPDVMDKVQKKLNSMPPLTIPAPKFDKDTLQKIQDETDIIMSGITDTIAAAAEGLGSALTGKGGFFGSILKVIGSSLEALGKYVITTSALVAKIRAAIDKAFLTGNPIAGIGIGIAMIALGAAMQNIGKAKFATGGIVTRPTLALVGEQGPERITPLGYEGQASNAMAGEVVFNISGNNLRGVLRRADQTAYNTF